MTASTDTTITATVPTGALPGLVFVLVGDDSAVGMVPFLPLDTAGVAVPVPTRTKLYYISPAKGGVETVVTVVGFEFDEDAVPKFNDRYSSRLYNVQTVNFPLIGDGS